MTATRVFNHKRYKFHKSLSSKGEAQKEARKLRNQKRLTHITFEDMIYHSKEEERYIVWVK